ncbi:MAG: glucose-phosphate adenylyltransferase [Bryobacterales bacterium]|jgi:glucose-1-phosphate adenylyltransferase|nr:glucose-phosphate adenylyltransferase [Bryobacterales bacterium]
MVNVLAILLAGGAGERLFPLTRDTAKPGVPFGGVYRIIDFTLSNCVNSDLRRIFILTQYKSLELNRHIRDGWQIYSSTLGEFIEVLPPMKRVSEEWYQGTADAIYQNLQSILTEAPDHVMVLSADHIYKMDYCDMLAWHRAQRADVTIATIQINPAEADRFGVAQINHDYRIYGFEEKPKHGNPVRSAFDPDMISASMGIYIFNTKVLAEELIADANDPNSSHDFGKDILPRCLGRRRVVAYDFIDINAKAARYWRDVGTLDAYYDANMDLISVTPEFNLYDLKWPIRMRPIQAPPAKFVFGEEGQRMGAAIDSMVSPGCIVSGGRVRRSVLAPFVRVNSYSDVDSSIVMPHAVIGRYSRVRRAILDEGVVLPENSSVGFDPEADRAMGRVVTESGITVVPSPVHRG